MTSCHPTAIPASPLGEPAVAFHPFELAADPYPVFALARRATPVFHAPEIDHWVVTRHADVKRILTDHERWSAANTIQPMLPLDPEAQRILREGDWRLAPALGNNDLPDHARFRKCVHRAFTPRRVAELEPFMRATVEAAADRIAARHAAELMADVLADLPARVILKLTGAPLDLLAAIKEGSRLRILFVWRRPTAAEQVELARGLVAFWQRLRELVQRRLATLRDDLTSELLAVRGGDDAVLTLDEIASVLFAFFTAGHATTSALLGNAVRQLAEHGLWDALAREPQRIPGAIEEVLRFDSPVISWRRRAKRDVAVAGTTTPAGAQVLLLLGSANHDGDVFDAPEAFDIDRANASRHLSFGHGIHHCLGASLARLEARVALEVLTRRLPGLGLAEEFRFETLPNTTFRGPRELAVRWREAA